LEVWVLPTRNHGHLNVQGLGPVSAPTVNQTLRIPVWTHSPMIVCKATFSQIRARDDPIASGLFFCPVYCA
jgi:hypothetical protein